MQGYIWQIRGFIGFKVMMNQVEKNIYKSMEATLHRASGSGFKLQASGFIG